ncbi:MAG TPA: DUF2306 domain-containing protein [Bacteroidia bacterium]|nr:DUF2306 domain-containing protein [Bacteroidia bacterium]
MTIFNIFLVIHILCGFTAFFVAPVAMIVKKGGDAHRSWGKVFFWAMAGVCGAALVMAPMHNNVFLTLVAVFSFYLAFSGYRSLYRKNLKSRKDVKFIDWFVVSLNAVFCIVLLMIGILKLPESFGVISIVFGTIGLLNSVRDLVSFFRPRQVKGKWFFSHMGGMIGAYIAAVSAFSAVNLNFDWLPVSIQWLWPTLIGVPGMFIWMKNYRRKFSKGRSIREEVVVLIHPDAE